MSKIKDVFFGGAEKRAGKAITKASLEAGQLGATAAETAGGLRATAAEEAAAIRVSSESRGGRALQRGGLRAAELVGGRFGEIEERLDPFIQPGAPALELQAALSGALGPEAQAQAFAQFQEDPGTQFLRDQGLRLIGTGAAVTGGVGGGERLRELTKFSQGLALQDLSSRFSRLGQVAGTGLQAATQLGGFGAEASAQQAAAEQAAAKGEALGIAGAGEAEAGGVLGSAAALAAAQQQVALAQATGLTGAAVGKAEGLTGAAAGFRGGLTQLAGGITGFQSGGITGALEGAFGV